MTKDEIISIQKSERRNCLDAILTSTSSKKIIIAGAGTGKTFTFKEILVLSPKGENIAMTFIRRLSYDMHTSFGHLAEVKTFHAYCKKVLHEQNGKVELVPFLTIIIEEDAQYLGLDLKDFDKKFQLLEEGCPEILFYLDRGDYYDSVSFNDSVYRLYKLLQSNPQIVPNFNNILIDEYQDFNLLEVSFIDELAKKGSILIVGDDDQAVYEGRSSKPDYLRHKFSSGLYEKFDLPYCSRCPEVIVKATNTILETAEKMGFLKHRIPKRYECFIESKGKENTKFPKIITVQCTVAKMVAKYVDLVIQSIDADDISESWKEGSEYTTALIVGPKQYLTIIQKELSERYPQINYKLKDEISVSLLDGYDILLENKNSNLGLRIIIDFFLHKKEVKSIIKESKSGKSMIDIIGLEFLSAQSRAIEIMQMIRKGENLSPDLETELKNIVGSYYDQIVEHYSPPEKEEEEKTDKTKPSILLSSFVGCKGLSAGHVLILGANNGSIPKDVGNISDVEICQFVVALTRTRKQCHIISNKWLISPRSNGSYSPANEKSIFLDMIPKQFIEDKGSLTAKNISTFVILMQY